MLRSDLPLGRDAASVFLPAIIGFMVFLATLALAGSLGLDNLLARWRSQIESAFTVELPRVEGESAAATAARLRAVMGALEALPEIQRASLLDETEKARLLAPWLGPDIGSLDLPLPDLISIVLRPGASIDPAVLAAKLARLSPGASIDDHGRWRGAIAGISRTARLAALGLLVLVGTAAVLTVVFVARAGLASHRGAIEILHLVGAHDAYIAGQFQRRTLVRGFLGGALGAAAGSLVFEAGRRLLPGLAEAGLALRPLQWAALAALPVAAALLAMATARVTVLSALARMM